MSVAQVLRQAEELKAAVKDTSRGASEAWVSRQNLQDLYQKLLVQDLEYALDKKVEQDLWNHAFKNQINTLQSQAKDKQNPKKPEIVASLNLFLETASGFYLQLLEELCSAFKLDLPCRRKSSSIGILKEYGPVANKIRAPKKSSCMYICQHCLVHLGDIARYREQSDQAQTYYKHAANLVPYNGQPYNQLAILEAARGNKLSTVVYYVRSIAVKHPFPVAGTNLEKFYTKITKDIPECGRKLSMSELTISFLQFNALVHLSSNLVMARTLSTKLLTSLPSHISSTSYSSYQLVQMITVLLYTLHHCQRRQATTGQSQHSNTNNNDQTSSSSPQQEKTDPTKKETAEALKGAQDSILSNDSTAAQPRNDKNDDEVGYNLCFSFIASLMELLLSLTPVKQEAKAKEYHTLPAIKVLLDWLHSDPELINSPQLASNSIYQNLSKLLNVLQFNTNQKDVPIDLEKYVSVPLPEDCELQCFQPINSSHSDLDFHLMPLEGLSPELEMRIRCQRLVEHGLWLCEEFPSLNLINVQKQKSGRLHFSVPSGQGQVSAGTDTDSSTERKPSHRQNVAIQAIMQHKAKKDTSTGPTSDSNQGNIPVTTATSSAQNTTVRAHGKGSKKAQKEAEKLESNTMVNTATETQEPQEKPIPSWAWDSRPPGLEEMGGPSSSYLPQSPHNPWSPSAASYDQSGGQWYPGYSGESTERTPTSTESSTHRDASIRLYPQEPTSSAAFGATRADPFSQTAEARNWTNQQQVQLDKAIKQTAEQLKQLSQKIQQTKMAAQRDPDLLLLHQQLQLQPRAALIEQQLREKYQQYDEMITRDLVTQQQLQQQQQQLLQQRQALKGVDTGPWSATSQPPQQRQESETGAWSATTQQQQQQRQGLKDGEPGVWTSALPQQQQQRQPLKEVETGPWTTATPQQHQQQQQQRQAETGPWSTNPQQQQMRQARPQLPPQASQQPRQPQQPAQLRQGSTANLDLRQASTANMDLRQTSTANMDLRQASTANMDLRQASTANMDLSQMFAVMEMSKAQSGRGEGAWGEKGPGPARPTTLSPTGTIRSNDANLSMFGGVPPVASPGEFQPYSPVEPSQAEASTAKSYLEKLFSAAAMATGEEQQPNSLIPTSYDSEEELRRANEPHYNRQPGSGLLTSDLSSLVIDLARMTEEVPKPDSPPLTVGSLYNKGQDSNSYSLFSQSPWGVQLSSSSADTKSHASSSPAFGSSGGSSLRTTPDLHPPSNHDDRPSPVPGLGGLNLGFSLANPPVTTATGWTGPPNTTQWSAGPSPLQKLLQQQKNQRQNDPH